MKNYLKSLSNIRIGPTLLLKYPREIYYNLVLKSKGKRRGTIIGGEVSIIGRSRDFEYLAEDV
jgi:hypothetical protein